MDGTLLDFNEIFVLTDDDEEIGDCFWLHHDFYANICSLIKSRMDFCDFSPRALFPYLFVLVTQNDSHMLDDDDG